MRQKLGQHFLKDVAQLEKIADAAPIHEGEVIVEIGPGHGELTSFLVKKLRPLRTAKLFLLERDTTLIPHLKTAFKDLITEERLIIIEGNALETLPALIKEMAEDAPYRIFGNIPYYITGFLFRIIEELPHKPISCVFTIQKEVAERAVAEPPRMNLLAASIQYWADAELLLVLPKTLFSPPPEVDSAVIRLTTRAEKGGLERAHYYALLKTLFKQPRKTIANNLKELPEAQKMSSEKLQNIFESLYINPTARPQDIHIDTLKQLAILLYT